LEGPLDDPTSQAIDPPQRRQRILDAIRQLLIRESQVQPLVAVCEDLPWIDMETQAILDRMIESLPTARILLLITYRSDHQHLWGGKTSYTQLRLDPLPPAYRSSRGWSMDVAPSAKFFSLQNLSTYSSLPVKPPRSYLQHPKHLPPHYRLPGKILVDIDGFRGWLERFKDLSRPTDIDQLVNQVMAEIQWVPAHPRR
jgi:hypothetical protein